MKPTNQKTLLSVAMSTALGLGMIGQTNADPIISIKVEDVGSTVGGSYNAALDGKSGGFRFSTINPETYLGTSLWTGDVGAGAVLFGGLANPAGSFSTGFIFAGSPFVPYTFGAGAVGDIDFNNNLTLASMDFGGNFAGTVNFNLPPDPGTLQVNWIEPAAAGDERLLSFQWEHYITSADDPSGAYVGFTTRWIIEGTATIEDLAPQITLNGVDPATALPFQPYVDAGAVCNDFVDGVIPVTTELDNFPVQNCNIADAGAPGGSFTCEYNCTDSQLQNATPVTRTINVAADSTAPVVTLLVGPPEQGRIDSPDGSSVEILVGKTYVDAGATCVDDLDGNIPLGPLFTVDPDPPTVSTNVPTPPGGVPITYSCMDSSGNGPTNETRTVTVIADNERPILTLGGAPEVNISLGTPFVPNSPPSTCIDTNPVDPDPVDISQNVMFTPQSVDTSVPGTTIFTYTCEDDAGNAAEPVTQTVNVVAGNSFEILSMTISDIDSDGLAGCFKFNSLDVDTCASANRFSSDNSVTGLGGGNTTIPGSGTDLDGNGDPIGIRFGTFQDTKAISPGFNFSGFPFEPFTFNPPSEDAAPPKGTVTIAGSEVVLLIDSMPFSGLYSSSQPNKFFLDPDSGTLTAVVTNDNNDDNGTTRTFNYLMDWSHVITPAEDPTGAFNNFNAFWRLEGVVTVNSTPVVVNLPPVITDMAASQDDRVPTRLIVSSDGLVTVEVDATDPDSGSPLKYSWTQSESRLIDASVGGVKSDEFVFDPAVLEKGIYAVRVVVTDDKDATASAEILLNLTAAAPVLGPGDSDGDGIPDDVEGFGDDDNDGLPNYHDAIDGNVEPTRNYINYADRSQGEIVSSAGKIQMGNVAFTTGKDIFLVTEGDIAAGGGPGGTPVSNADDVQNRIDGLGHSGGIFDFLVSGLPLASSVQVVLPETSSMPVMPRFRQYTPGKGWFWSGTAGGNAQSSTKSVGGICPGPDSTSYNDTDGMSEGDNCVRVTIVDGGSNDADETVNGVVQDPGTVSGDGPVPKSDGSSGGGCVVSTEPVNVYKRFDWFMLAGLFGWLVIRSRRGNRGRS